MTYYIKSKLNFFIVHKHYSWSFLKKYPLFQGLIPIFFNPHNVVTRQEKFYESLYSLVQSLCYIIYNILKIDCIYIQKHILAAEKLFHSTLFTNHHLIMSLLLKYMRAPCYFYWCIYQQKQAIFC